MTGQVSHGKKKLFKNIGRSKQTVHRRNALPPSACDGLSGLPFDFAQGRQFFAQQESAAIFRIFDFDRRPFDGTLCDVHVHKTRFAGFDHGNGNQLDRASKQLLS